MVLLLIVGVCLMLVTPKFKKIQSLTDDLKRVTRENFTGLSVVRTMKKDIRRINLKKQMMYLQIPTCLLIEHCHLCCQVYRL